MLQGFEGKGGLQMHAYSKRKKTRPHTKREKKKTQIIIKPSLMATKSKLAEAAATAQCVPSPGKSTSGGTRLLDGYSAPEVGKRRVGQSTKLSVVDHAKAELLLTYAYRVSFAAEILHEKVANTASSVTLEAWRPSPRWNHAPGQAGSAPE